MLTCHVKFFFVDRKGAEAQLRVKLPIGASVDTGADGIIDRLASALSALSSAKLVSYEILYHSGLLAGDAPAAASDCFRRVSLLYRNGEEFASITIPSFVALPIDPADPYGHCRVTASTLVLSGLLGFVQVLPQGTVKPDGTPTPDTFVVGVAAGGLHR